MEHFGMPRTIFQPIIYQLVTFMSVTMQNPPKLFFLNRVMKSDKQEGRFNREIFKLEILHKIE